MNEFQHRRRCREALERAEENSAGCIDHLRGSGSAMRTWRKGKQSALGADGIVTEAATQRNQRFAVCCDQKFFGLRKQGLVRLVVDLQGEFDGEHESLQGGWIVVSFLGGGENTSQRFREECGKRGCQQGGHRCRFFA